MNYFLEKMKAHYNPQGYIALFSVILLGTIGLAISVSVIFSGIMSSRTNFEIQKKAQSRMVANTCAEQALQHLLGNILWEEMSATSTFYSGTYCTYTITSTGTDPLVLVRGVSDTTTTKISIRVSSTTPRIKLSSWQEVGDF